MLSFRLPLFAFALFCTQFNAQSLPPCSSPVAPAVPGGGAVITSVANFVTRQPFTSGINPNFTSGMEPSGPVSSGELVSIMGSWLAADSTYPMADGTWPASLNGAEVLVSAGGVVVNAPILYAGMRRDGPVFGAIANAEIVAQLPFNLEGGTVTLQVRVSGRCVGNQFTLPLALNTALFVQPPYTVAVGTKSGSAMSIYGTGLGDVVDPAFRAGQAATSPIPVRANVSVTLGDMPATVSYAGVSGLPGLYQVNFQVPTLVPGTYITRFAVDGTSAGSILVQVQ
ncbi:MAG: hypothetical protein C5B51_14705 [Terriglobia bacterium]|nr:MAG: hypothetical protein C5B51_14705 [Terriglobia bacterium]